MTFMLDVLVRAILAGAFLAPLRGSAAATSVADSSATASPSPAPARVRRQPTSFADSERRDQWFDCFWSQARDNVYDVERGRLQFTEERHDRLLERARQARDLDEFAVDFNRFLDSLQISHTRFATTTDLEFFVWGGFASMNNPDTLQLAHIGMQYARTERGWVIRNVLEGYPAERAGLRRGDLLVTANGLSFHPYHSFAPGKPSMLGVRRNGRPLVISVLPVQESIHRSMAEAVRRSVQRRRIDGKQIGYVHLWAVYGALEESFAGCMRDSLAGCAGVVLDLRDGFGGGWTRFADAFFENRRGYPIVSGETRDHGVLRVVADSIPDHPCYRGVVVAVTNEGSRSGKEGLAYQLRKAGRARLVGTTTAGAFRGGTSFNCPGEYEALLILAINALTLDGQVLEGVGVEPDVRVEYPLDRTSETDPQRERAFVEMGRLLRPGGKRRASP